MSSQLSANFVHCPNRKLHTSENAGLKSANKRLQRHVPTLLTGLPFGFCFCQYLCNTQFNRLTGKSLNKTRILCRRLALISKTENGPILLVEDDASDEFMTLRALKRLITSRTKLSYAVMELRHWTIYSKQGSMPGRGPRCLNSFFST